MKDLFMCLLLNLQKHGKIVAANLYRDGKFATLEIDGEDAVYTVTINREEKKSEGNEQ